MNKYIINKILYNGFISSLALIILISCQSESHYTHKPISEFSNDKDSKLSSRILLEHGKPMLFGPENNFGIILDGSKFKKVEIH